jgi:16S rRNA (cytosine1402-N4)-methyltransferase
MEHTSVMLAETVSYLAPRPDGTYVDCTTGAGGHCGAIARQLTTGRVIALDRDAESLAVAREKTADVSGRITFAQSRFSELGQTLARLGVERVDGLLCDLGFSMLQMEPERGFSFQYSGPLDMRMSRDDELTAADLVNGLTERELADLFWRLGGERRSRRVAKSIVRARPVHDCSRLAEIVAAAVPRTGKLHPATRVFQALRMAVNDEPGELKALLEGAPKVLAPGARWVVIAFHSGDDREVKRAFQALAREGRVRILTKHVVRPGRDEIERNPASRSAVLRAVEVPGASPAEE